MIQPKAGDISSPMSLCFIKLKLFQISDGEEYLLILLKALAFGRCLTHKYMHVGQSLCLGCLNILLHNVFKHTKFV